MKKSALFLFLAGLPVLFPVFAADPPAVYPVPRKALYSGGFVEPAKAVSIRRGEPGAGELLKDVPEVSGAYRLIVKPGSIVIAGHDDRGVFYGMQTLRQLADASGKVLACDVADWPDIEFRGTVEGFYGQPWSHEARLSQLKFYGQNKMNTYIYGPKDDPYHSSPRWREAYPAAQAAQIRELAAVAKENHVDFVWAIHPGKDIKWTDEDMHNVIKKFQMMYDLGVRSFAVFFDDIGGEGTRADKQADLLNMIQKEFVSQKPDVTQLLMCPTQYNRSWASGDYLDVLGERLNPSIHVMWTGDTVVHDITLEGQNWVNKRLKRSSYVWWNFPVTDFVRDHLCLGRVYGLTQEPGARESMGGFVSNPMDKPEASKITLFGIADYAWNINGFESDASWREGIRRLFPKCAEAVQTFADHNSDHGPNGHAFRREESADIAPMVEKVLEAARRGGTPAGDAMVAVAGEFRKMEQAPASIRAHADNPGFLKETEPWLASFEQLGKAGQSALAAVELSLGGGEGRAAADALVKATDALAMMEHAGRPNGRKLFQPGVKTGSRVMSPAVHEMLEMASPRIYKLLTNRNSFSAQPVLDGGNSKTARLYADKKAGTFWHSGVLQKKGQWFGLDFGEEIPLRSVNLLMGRNDKDKDFPDRGQLEVSSDLKTWEPLGEETAGMNVTWRGQKARHARAVRYRLLEDKPKWLGVREFYVNTPPAARAFASVKGMNNLMVRKDSKMIGINRVNEVFSMKPGEFISMELPEPVDATWLEINVENPDLNEWGEIALETVSSPQPVIQKVKRQGNHFIAGQQELPRGIRKMTLTNKSTKAVDIPLTMFKLDVPPTDPGRNEMFLSDGDLATAYACRDGLNVTVRNQDVPEARRVMIIGSAHCAVRARKADGAWEPVGMKEDGSVKELPLPAGTKEVKLSHDGRQPGKGINEVIFL